MLLKQKEVYRYWLTLQRKWPRVERLGLGQRIEQIFLDILETTFASMYLRPEQKIIGLGRAITKLDLVKFFMQLAWESGLISTQQQAEMTSKFEEIGRMLGGWKKGLEKKLSPEGREK